MNRHARRKARSTMAVIRFTVDIGKGPREIAVDPKKLKLSFYDDVEEAQETGKFRPLLRAYGQYLGFTRDEMREMTLEDFERVTQAIKEANEAIAIPNA